MKPKLLVLELWGIGDLIIASPFLREACRAYEVTLLAQAYAEELRPHFWPKVKVLPFRMPWTAHRGKYRLHAWPWTELARLVRQMRRSRFDAAASARWDPRDDAVMLLSGARRRIGFPRMGSALIETTSVDRPNPLSHRHERWRVIGAELGLDVPPVTEAVKPISRPHGTVLIHTGAGKLLRVWPLERFHSIATRLRAAGFRVRVACDPEQFGWWKDRGEPAVEVPSNLAELLEVLSTAGVFIGNDSGPGHVAGYVGVPTFTFFGPQVPEWFVPMHPQAEWIEGTPCPYKPCFDYCEFPDPFCLTGIKEDQAWTRVKAFVERHLTGTATPGAQH
ncbi:MAG: glycosyltransferase family 9 protein [Verrucomicrobia bacterium]|jgi:heptosyltransferase-2|nr:glycosyltransferase family 9 protein [Verrucomicrobiota bacterium]